MIISINGQGTREKGQDTKNKWCVTVLIPIREHRVRYGVGYTLQSTKYSGTQNLFTLRRTLADAKSCMISWKSIWDTTSLSIAKIEREISLFWSIVDRRTPLTLFNAENDRSAEQFAHGVERNIRRAISMLGKRLSRFFDRNRWNNERALGFTFLPLTIEAAGTNVLKWTHSSIRTVSRS